MAEPLLLVDSISAGYLGRNVLHEISLQVEEGSPVALIAQRHGKTTCCARCPVSWACMAAASRSPAPNIHRPPSGIRFRAGASSHVPQGDMLFPDMTVLENLQMGAYLPPQRQG